MDRPSVFEIEGRLGLCDVPKRLKVSPSLDIKDCSLFISSHLGTAYAQEGNPAYSPYIDRLLLVLSILEK